VHTNATPEINAHVLADHSEQMYEVIWLSFVHQSNDSARAGKRSSQYGLKQRMRRNLHHDSVVGNVLQSFVEQHRTDEVVDMVVGR